MSHAAPVRTGLSRNALALVLAATTCGAQAQTIEYRPILLSGQQAPGLPAGVVFDRPIGVGYSPVPQIDDASNVLLGALLAGPGVTDENDLSYWRVDASGQFTLLLREGTPIGDTGETLSFVTRAAMGDDGAVAFRGGFDSTHPFAAVWHHDPSGGVSILAREGGPAPAPAEDMEFFSLAGNFLQHSSLNIGGDGAVLVTGGMREVGTSWPNFHGIWMSDAGAPLSTLAYTDEPTMPLADGYLLGLPSPTVAADDSGRVYFTAWEYLNGSNGYESLWVWDEASGKRRLASVYDTPPTMSSNNMIGEFHSIALAVNDAGQFATRIDLRNRQTGSWNGISGIWLGDQSGLTDLGVRRGRSIPGFPAGSRFEEPGSFSLNASGQLAFTSNFLSGDGPTTGVGIWSRSPGGSANLIVRDGDPMPGTGGQHFDAVAVGVLGNNNEIIFAGRAVDPDAPTWPVQFLEGTFIATTDGNILPIGVEGGTIDVNPDPGVTDARTLIGAPHVISLSSDFTSITGNGAESGQGFVFNSQGEFVFQAFFDDGTGGVFVASYDNGCPADVNADGLLSPADFNAWVLAFNSQADGCDQNNDGACNPADFNAWILNFNAGC
ncbi:MAG: choice-of-anchor tandem repeat NxxGxxAF-containing protein [Planctomycetota bacterium]